MAFRRKKPSALAARGWPTHEIKRQLKLRIDEFGGGIDVFFLTRRSAPGMFAIVSWLDVDLIERLYRRHDVTLVTDSLVWRPKENVRDPEDLRVTILRRCSTTIGCYSNLLTRMESAVTHPPEARLAECLLMHADADLYLSNLHIMYLVCLIKMLLDRDPCAKPARTASGASSSSLPITAAAFSRTGGALCPDAGARRKAAVASMRSACKRRARETVQSHFLCWRRAMNFARFCRDVDAMWGRRILVRDTFVHVRTDEQLEMMFGNTLSTH